MSLHPDDQLYSRAYFMQRALEMTIDRINNPQHRCGVSIGGKNYSLRLRSLADSSNATKVRAVASTIAADNDTHFLLAGYSSALTQHLTPYAKLHEKVVVAAGSNALYPFENNEWAFGILHPAHRNYDAALDTFQKKGAKTVVYVGQESIPSVDFWNQAYVEPYGLVLVEKYTLNISVSQQQLVQVAKDVSSLQPDMVVLAVYTACSGWIQALRSIAWLPRALLLNNCIDRKDILDEIGARDMSYISGIVNWSPVQPSNVQDAVTGWTAQVFDDKFQQHTLLHAPTYHAAAAAASISVLVQAIERANSTDSRKVRDVLSNGTFDTVFGRTAFDENGQGTVPSLVVQYDSIGQLHAVGPAPERDLNYTLAYPMPTWVEQDCIHSGKCEDSGGICQDNGTCGCNKTDMEPYGTGADSYCKASQEEDMTYIDGWIQNVGITLFAIQAFLSVFFIMWVLRYRERGIVKASQPIFLVLLALGCLILASSIIPRTVQGDYRYEQDEDSCQLTEEPNPNIERVDAACMASIWLFAVGFCVVFSALFAKVWRVKKLTENARLCRRKKVEAKDVIYIMVIMLAIVVAILLTWQLVDPLKWQRDVLEVDADGCAIRSVGECRTEHEHSYYIFIGTFVAFALGCLLYALYLSYITRKQQLTEGAWITASIISIFQILLLGVPVMFIVKDDTNVYFFVGASLTFLMSATITLLIFGPKFYGLHFHKEDDEGSRATTTNISNRSRHGSIASNHAAFSGPFRSSTTR